MSTDLMIRCVDHDPYIQSDDVGSNLSYLPKIRDAIANRSSIVRMMKDILERNDYPQFDGYDGAMNWFLYSHPNCNLEIWDEYGREYAVHEENDDSVISMTSPLGRIHEVEIAPDGVKILFDLNEEGKRLMKKWGK